MNTDEEIDQPPRHEDTKFLNFFVPWSLGGKNAAVGDDVRSL